MLKNNLTTLSFSYTFLFLYFPTFHFPVYVSYKTNGALGSAQREKSKNTPINPCKGGFKAGKKVLRAPK